MNYQILKLRLFLAILLCQVTSSQLIYNDTQYTLGSNLVLDSTFSDYPLPTSASTNAFYNGRVSSWNCDKNCQLTSPYRQCINNLLVCNISSTIQGIDLDSNQFDNISQSINVTAPGQYIVYVEWIPPLFNSIGKSFRVFIDNITVITVTSNTSIKQSYSQQKNITLNAGSHLLSMIMFGTTPDSHGIIINSVKVHQLIPIAQQNVTNNQTNVTNTTQNTTNNQNNSTNLPTSPTSSQNTTQNQTVNPTLPQSSGQFDDIDRIFYFFVDDIFLNDASQFINTIPGNRIVFNFLTEFFSFFDRLYLYYYHHQNNTFYAQVFLRKSAEFNQNKSTLSQTIFQICNDSSSICTAINEGYDYLLSQLNQKYVYSSDDFLKKNSNGIGFFANHLVFLYFQVPFVLLEMFLLYQLFRLLFNFKFSVFLRKYSLHLIIFFLFFEGNIEEFGFYLFSELSYFFSTCFVHKMGNVIIVLILYLIVLFSVGGLIWCKCHYKKLTKYFVEYYGSSLSTLIFEDCERYVFPLVLGLSHAFPIQNLGLQSVMLAIVEVLYLLLRVTSLRMLKVEQKMKIVFSFTASAMRVIFIATFYLFEISSNQIINTIHRNLIIIYIACWLLETTWNILCTIYQFISTISNKLKVSIQSENLGTKQLTAFNSSLISKKNIRFLGKTWLRIKTYFKQAQNKQVQPLKQQNKTISKRDSKKSVYITKARKMLKSTIGNQNNLTIIDCTMITKQARLE